MKLTLRVAKSVLAGMTVCSMRSRTVTQRPDSVPVRLAFARRDAQSARTVSTVFPRKTILDASVVIVTLVERLEARLAQLVTKTTVSVSVRSI